MENKKEAKKVLITDLDNTLFDWFDIWCATFIPLLNKVEEISGVDREALLPEIKEVHQRHGTAEYAFLLQELPTLKNIYGNSDNLLKKLDSAVHISRSSKKKHLKLYDGVRETLEKLKNKGVKVVGYTESKEWYSKYRIKSMGLDGLLDIVYSPEDHDVPIPESKRSSIDLEKTEWKNTPKDEIKPNPKLLLDIIDGISASVEDCVYIGDSEIKDIDMAVDAGVSSVFAKYGNAHFDERLEEYNLLRAVTHWSSEMVEREKSLKEKGAQHKANYEVNSFAEILDKFDFRAF